MALLIINGLFTSAREFIIGYVDENCVQYVVSSYENNVFEFAVCHWN